MSAERLREAAGVLRERAGAATPGPWKHNGYFDVYECSSEHGDVVAEAGMITHDATYIATMSPPVALALADVLDTLAYVVEHEPECDYMAANREHIALADAILGGVA